MSDSVIPSYDYAIDKGLEGVVACSTAISFIQNSTLSYRGYSIEDLSTHSHFEETVYLLWKGVLPTEDELFLFKLDLSRQYLLDPDYIKILKTIPTHVHPMSWLITALSLLSHWDMDASKKTEEANYKRGVNVLAKMASLICAYEAIRRGTEIIAPKPDRGIAWNFLYMLKGGEEPTREFARIFDVCLILHADHEVNCSTFAARVTSSSLSDLYSALVSAMSALKGPLHGGANEQVMLMLKKIGSLEKTKDFIKEVLLSKEKVMGMGHRVYKHGDPRSAVLKKLSNKLTEKIGEHYLYEMSVLIDETIYKEKGLMPNVDFYSSTVYYSMGIPIDLFTPIFALSRVSGWIAHVTEQYSLNRIYRPRAKWVGKTNLIWNPIFERG